ncbi:hypothetical protein BJF90_07440 [Pseudonocardia sp. CNS-004]|nr:hypothetical protein BJF90_07440 [Pseudonocardia sp. CNS-004]
MIEVYGSSAGAMRLRRRSSAGSRPNLRAASSSSASMTRIATGWPTPRYTASGALFVIATRRWPR